MAGDVFGDAARAADRDEMKTFLNTAFLRCGGVEGWVALRAFAHEGNGQAVENRWHLFNSAMLDYAVEIATGVANRSVPQRAVFSPPVALFGDQVNEKGGRVASADNVVCCPVLAVELDERPTASLQVLESVLGQPTIVVASGGKWVGEDPGAFGDAPVEQKLHAYWRLRVPAIDADDRETLRVARMLACRLVGADQTAVSLAHPMRWPGSWHTKDPGNPVLCRIAGGDHQHDIDLAWAVGELTAAVEAAGLQPGDVNAGLRGVRMGFKTEHEWSAAALMDAARLIPNKAAEWGNDSWGLWVRMGMAFYDASHGSADGLDAFHAWSARGGDIYDVDVTDHKWSRFKSSPPKDMSGGTLLREMRGVEPDYVMDRDIVGLWFEEPGGDENESPPVPEKIVVNSQNFGELELPDDAAAPVFVRELNRRHAFAMNRGQAVVVNFEDDGGVSFSNAASFFARYANRPTKVGKKEMSIGEAWFEHDRRRQYVGGVEFDPRGVRAGVLNLWRGLPPLEGVGNDAALGRALAHIRDVICAGSERDYAYLIGWLAHMMQRPGDKPGVAVVLRGGKGTGKDTMGEMVREMLGYLYVHAASQDQLTGRFNGHLAGKLFMHVEEAAWEGSKRAEGRLKSLVTAPVSSVESKGVNAVMMRSCLRILMTSNEDYVVPASVDERRWFVLDVSDAHQQSEAWFGPLQADIASGAGPAALRAYLLGVDLSGFNVRAVPRTAALADQQVESLEGFDRFWADLLDEGTAFEGWADGPVSVPRDTVRRSYEDWERRRARSGRPTKVDTPQQIGRKLVEFTGLPVDKLSSRPYASDGNRIRFYHFPSLDLCIEAWRKRFER